MPYNFIKLFRYTDVGKTYSGICYEYDIYKKKNVNNRPLALQTGRLVLNRNWVHLKPTQPKKWVPDHTE